MNTPTLYFHGTNTTVKAEAIQTEGLLPDRPSIYAASDRPMPGRIYLSSRPSMAANYARWPSKGRWSDLDADHQKHPFGYIFVVPDAAITQPLMPDEDDVGLFMSDYASECNRRGELSASGPRGEIVQINGESVEVREYRFQAPLDDPESIEKRIVWERLARHVTPRQMTRMVYDCNTSAVGRHLLWKFEADAVLHANLIRWGRGSVSHLGALMPSEAWRIQKSALSEIGNYGDLQKLGEPWPLMAALPTP